MKSITKLFFLIFTISVIFSSFYLPALGAKPPEEKTAITGDEDISHNDLGSPSTSWFSSIFRHIKIMFTRDPLVKSDIELEEANAQMWRLGELVASGLSGDNFYKKSKKIEKKYSESITDIHKNLKEIDKTSPESKEKTEQFVGKYIDQQVNHELVWDKAKESAPDDLRQGFTMARESQLEDFGNTIQEVEDSNRLEQKFSDLVKNTSNSLKKRLATISIIRTIQKTLPDINFGFLDEGEKKSDNDSAEPHSIIDSLKQKHEEVKEHQEENKEGIKEALE